MIISFRVQEEEATLIRDHAHMSGESVSEFVRNTVMERIEDEMDIQAYQCAMEEFRKDPVTFTQDEVERILASDEEIKASCTKRAN